MTEKIPTPTASWRLYVALVTAIIAAIVVAGLL